MINRDELLKMARTLGTESGCESCFMFNHQELEDFSNAILERAAVEFNQPHAEYFGHEIQETIRALKTQYTHDSINRRRPIQQSTSSR